jgi:hypothetical protein
MSRCSPAIRSVRSSQRRSEEKNGERAKTVGHSRTCQGGCSDWTLRPLPGRDAHDVKTEEETVRSFTQRNMAIMDTVVAILASLFSFSPAQFSLANQLTRPMYPSTSLSSFSPLLSLTRGLEIVAPKLREAGDRRTVFKCKSEQTQAKRRTKCNQNCNEQQRSRNDACKQRTRTRAAVGQGRSRRISPITRWSALQLTSIRWRATTDEQREYVAHQITHQVHTMEHTSQKKKPHTSNHQLNILRSRQFRYLHQTHRTAATCECGLSHR